MMKRGPMALASSPRATAIAAVLLLAAVIASAWFWSGGGASRVDTAIEGEAHEPFRLLPLAKPPRTQSAESRSVAEVLAAQDEILVEPVVSEREGRLLTVLIPYDRTRFFIDKGQPRGFEYDLVRQFEKHFNSARSAGDAPLQTLFVPVPFGQALPLLAEGKGDIAAGGFTITPERAARSRFSVPYMENVRELVVQAAGSAQPVHQIEDLAGRRVIVVANSSYAEHLRELNQTFVENGLAVIDIVEAPVALMSEDLLEMVHAGAIGLTVVDEHIGRLWAEVLDGLELTEIAIRDANRIAWAFSDSLSDSMVASIDAFLKDARQGSLVGNLLFTRYFEGTNWISNPLGPEAISEVSRYRPMFSRYAEDLGLDWRLVAAVAFQESGFDPFARSHAGAIGLMQVLPATAAEMGVTDLTPPEAQIKAGTRYLALLIDHLTAEGIDRDQAIDLALASYNAGPGRVAELRSITRDRLGLDPNRWFFNVERAAADEVGLEPVRYVANVHKYRLAFELGQALLTERAAQRETILESR